MKKASKFACITLSVLLESAWLMVPAFANSTQSLLIDSEPTAPTVSLDTLLSSSPSSSPVPESLPGQVAAASKDNASSSQAANYATAKNHQSSLREAVLMAAEPPADSAIKTGVTQSGIAPGQLTPNATEAAQLLNIMPQIIRLRAIRSQTTHAPDQLAGDEELALDMYLMEKVIGASLEVRTVADEIDEELAYAYDVRAILTAKRDRNVNYDFIATFLQGGTLATISGPLFLDKQSLAANLCLLTASGVSILLSSLALKLQRGGTRKSDTGTNMLAHYLDLNPPPDKAYPPLVWKFVNAVPPGKSESRRQESLRHWRELHRADPANTPHLEALSGIPTSSKPQSEGIRLLTDRIFMLHHVHAQVEQLDGALLDLLKAAQMY